MLLTEGWFIFTVSFFWISKLFQFPKALLDPWFIVKVLFEVWVVILPSLTVKPSGNAKTGTEGPNDATIAAAAAGIEAENLGFLA